MGNGIQQKCIQPKQHIIKLRNDSYTFPLKKKGNIQFLT